nr:11329_t:CDS:2 [Entrophospora candida]
MAVCLKHVQTVNEIPENVCWFESIDKKVKLDSFLFILAEELGESKEIADEFEEASDSFVSLW